MAGKNSPGNKWEDALSRVKPRELPVPSREVPVAPGVYIWFREGQPIYVGKALGADGLRGRLKAHFALGTDFSRSTFRASIAAAQLGLPRSVVRQRPSVITPDQTAVANQWLAQCEVGWIVCASTREAENLENALRAEWLPPLNLV
jgi:hypothetical protein